VGHTIAGAFPAASLVAATLIGCGGQTGGTTDAGGTIGTCSQLRGVTALLSSPLPTGDVYDGAKSDGRYVYFVGSTAIYRVPVSGGSLETVHAVRMSQGGEPSWNYGVNAGTIAWVYANPGSYNPAGLMVENASGVHDVAFPSGVTPVSQVLVDVDGNVFVIANLASGDAGAPTVQVWRWNPATGSAAQMPGVGKPDGSGVNLYWADRGQIIWASAEGGLYATDISTGTPHQLDETNAGFGSLLGVDANNVYGAGSICPMSACSFTVWGTPRHGGTPFVAYQTTAAYWTNGLQADDSGLYWVDWSTPGLYHAPLMRGAPAQLLARVGPNLIPSQFAMDACNLYWIDANGTGAKQQVMAVPK
jgi:hypothetical protein